MDAAEDYDDSWFKDFRSKLLRWYSKNHRALPWRDTQDPYAIWVSEIMLQQTQVATVTDYFNRFISRFPDVQSLAAAEEESVLSQWSGLGYYRRARSLHAAAKSIVQNYAGRFPRHVDEVLGLPGVGRYTAGAITSIAYDARNPILEANTIRLYARLLGLRDDPRTSASQADLWEFAEAILPKAKGSGKVNQAAMELGSLVCTPQTPACQSCPVKALCPTYRLGLQSAIPPPKAKQEITEEIHALAVVRKRNRLLMRRNQVTDWWAGLWDFPRLRISPLSRAGRLALKRMQPGGLGSLSPELRQRIEVDLGSVLGVQCAVDSLRFRITHGVTRFRIRLLCFDVRVFDGLKISRLDGDWKWMPMSPEPELPLTSPANKILRKLIAG